MAADRMLPPRPLWITIPGVFFQLFGAFVMPMVVGFAVAMALNATEVLETGNALVFVTFLILAPIAIVQVLGVVMKSWRDFAFWRSNGGLTVSRAADVVQEHLSVVTLRGWTLLFLGLVLVIASLYGQWAELGLMAVLGLLMFYTVMGFTVFVSTFIVRGFENAENGRRASIHRSMIPTVVQVGDAVDEVIRFQGVPVPWGYLLVVEDPLAFRLKTESRYVLGGIARSGAECRGRLRATPRGHYFLGPARLHYQDLLGITRISVPGQATCELKVLPRFLPVVVVDPPRSGKKTPDVVTRPHKFATDDYFRFREYATGDDTRRIHWRLSLKAGGLQVRMPETREIQTQEVLLVLDTFVPKGAEVDAQRGADEILDALVESWLGIALGLVQNGDRVSIAAPVGGHTKDSVQIESFRCKPGESPRWQDLGARARWQSQIDVKDLLEEAGDNVHAIVVTGRFVAAPQGQLKGKKVTWFFMEPTDALGPPDPGLFTYTTGVTGALSGLNWLFRLPYPAGDEENAVPRRYASLYQRYKLWTSRQILRGFAKARAGRIRQELQGRGDAVYRIEYSPAHIRLVGVQEGA